MKTYKIELVKVDKQYAMVTIDADSKKAALEIARGMNMEDFDETETMHGKEWRVKKDWSLLDLFGIGK